MFKGTVKFFNETKGYGFILEEDSKQEIFVHATGLVDKVRNGDTVVFETKKGKKGMTAISVKLA
ncbi:MAG TPA: cold shock domain-containing protein [Saprospiraceae bacterium]|nr:cold shock domain-containing protein [Saprospiraceae bacterium]HND88677.1 cold shock domain-containing protein [Saprospiraceae bacterium]